MPKKSGNAVDALVGKRIRARRLDVGLTQIDLGKALGVTFQQVQKYEFGTNRVSAGRLYEIGTVLNVPISYFYEGLRQPLEPDPTVSNEMVIGAALERIRHRPRRDLAVKLALAVIQAVEAD